jgi:hypothetical protein
MTTLSFTSDRTYRNALNVLMENDFCECSSCNEICHQDDSRYIDNDTYCEGCGESANFCEGTDEYTFEDVTEVQGCWYCDSYRNSYCWQDGSGEWYHDSTEYVEYEDTSERWTLEYAQENGWHDIENDCWYSEQPDDMSDDMPEDETPINVATPSYSEGVGMSNYHGDAIRNAWTVPKNAIGVEIETYCKGNRNALANNVRNAHNCAAERDGSLDSSKGIEIITPPMSPCELLTKIPAILDTIKAHNCESWKKSGYGIHVNIDCRNWDDKTKATFCNQFNAVNSTWLKAYAGRGDTDYTKLKTSDNEVEIPRCKYSAAGVKSGGRCEVRIFKSTLRTESVLAYVSLCQDALRYSIETLTTKPSHFLQWLKHNASPNTRKHLEYRGILEPMAQVNSGF